MNEITSGLIVSILTAIVISVPIAIGYVFLLDLLFSASKFDKIFSWSRRFIFFSYKKKVSPKPPSKKNDNE